MYVNVCVHPVSVALHSSTNLTGLANAIRLLASLNPVEPTGDDLLRAARALAAATAGLLDAAKPENIEVEHTSRILISLLTCSLLVSSLRIASSY